MARSSRLTQAILAIVQSTDDVRRLCVPREG
eukprot:CAMPEP_0113668046 /NCGR_PEP_ID=MMETSP0038_2-20120614/3779_1 /TAXON_ID=2898 /ORGANISM="Cryptomonas paramecium" /LENGTH=30 /DNA_ID=CAMNT_0000583739 /DNA_START=156 /DNA_END=248 /DNA_ORIENTATION=+ /assembly_acc=CAM_ASM_000170